MRITTVLVQLASVMASFGGLNRDILVTFVSVECLDDPNVERTTLPPILGRLTHKLLVRWFVLDEETFVQNAKPIVKAVHENTMATSHERPLLEINIQPLREQGMSDEEILELLTRRYYGALRRITALQILAERK